MENNQTTSNENKSKILWWVVGIIVVLAIGYGVVKFIGSDSSDAGTADLSAEDLSDIPTTGEGLVEGAVISDEDDVDFGEELV